MCRLIWGFCWLHIPHCWKSHVAAHMSSEVVHRKNYYSPIILEKPWFQVLRPLPEPIKNFFHCSTQLSMEFIMPINVKMPTIVGILTFISMINTPSDSLKPKVFIFQDFIILWAVEISCSVELSMKKFYILRARLNSIQADKLYWLKPNTSVHLNPLYAETHKRVLL